MKIALIVWLAALAAPAWAVTPEDLQAELGNAPNSHLHMLFEVTFMSIDVATVDAYLPAPAASAVGEHVREEKLSKDDRRAIREILLEADPVLLTMTFVRDSGWDKFLKGVKGNLETARKCDLITEEDEDAWWPTLEADFISLAERGVLEGDAVYYAVDGDVVRTVFFDAEGAALLDFTHESAVLAAGIRGGFFCEKSKFREKLIRSLVED